MIKLLKNAVLFTGIFLISSGAFGQNAVGGKIGINLAKWGGDLDEAIGFDNLESNLGLQFGGIFEIGINEKISIQPEFLYFQKGIRSDTEEEFFGETIRVESSIVLNYLF